MERLPKRFPCFMSVGIYDEEAPSRLRAAPRLDERIEEEESGDGAGTQGTAPAEGRGKVSKHNSRAHVVVVSRSVHTCCHRGVTLCKG